MPEVARSHDGNADLAMKDEASEFVSTIEARLTEIAGLDLGEEAVAEAIRASQGSEADRLLQVADRLLDLGKYAEAERIYRHLLRGQPDDPFLLNARAVCLANCSRYDEALGRRGARWRSSRISSTRTAM